MSEEVKIMAKKTTTTKSKLVRAAEWLDGLPSYLKGGLVNKWPIVISIVIVVVCLGVCLYLLKKMQTPGPEVTDQIQKQILDQVAADRAELEAKLEGLQADLFEYREKLRAIDEEIHVEAVERDKDHESIDSATTISGVDSVVYKRKGAGTVNAILRRPPGTETAAAGVDSNPY